ncbi:MAG: hypothetical protein H0X24_02570 [Ktedonobacterales bacterium]|nr:hypothetical protein [Ktedonobacterales bacterium]
MVKVHGRRHTLLARKGTGQMGSGLLWRYGPAGSARVTPPQPPTQQRELPLKGKTAKATPATTKKATTKSPASKRGTSVRNVPAAEVTSAVLAALASGAVRLAIEDIARQVVWEMEREQQRVMQQAGSYQRLGGF